MTAMAPRTVSVSRRPPTPSPVFDSYWRFAAMRQDIFHRRVRREPGPWTTDPVLIAHRFTNAYRAADRVSQYMIRHVAYDGDPAPEEVVFRVLLFKLFNRIETWELLAGAVGPLIGRDFDVEMFDKVMSEAFARGDRLYSAAYIMPTAIPGLPRKHRSHLVLLRQMLDDRLADRLTAAESMEAAYDLLLGYPGIGPFLAYQLVSDLNYTAVLNFSEMDFVVPGPGARSGIRKCFSDPGDYGEVEIIRLMADRQEEEFDRLGLRFENLWGRPLQLIDCQNLFCEVDKYARVMHPEVEGIGTRSRIKQRFRPLSTPVAVWFPPKWGINDHLPAQLRLPGDLDQPLDEVDANRPSLLRPNHAPDVVARKDRLLPLVGRPVADFQPTRQHLDRFQHREIQRPDAIEEVMIPGVLPHVGDDRLVNDDGAAAIVDVIGLRQRLPLAMWNEELAPEHR
jgi:hypothetical protein